MSNFHSNLNLCFLFALLNKYLNIFEFCKDDLVQLATTELKESWRFSVLILVWVVIECRTGHPVFDESLYQVIDACDYKQDWPPCDRALMILRFKDLFPMLYLVVADQVVDMDGRDGECLRTLFIFLILLTL